MKKLIIKIAVTLQIMTLLSCENKSRDKIDFNDDIAEIQNSIKCTMQLLDKLEDPVKINKMYLIDGDKNLIINGIEANAVNINFLNCLKNLSYQEKQQLWKLAFFLNRNKINSGSFDQYLGIWTFEYKYLPEGGNQDTRVIALLDYNTKLRLSSKVKILDQTQSIYLLQYR